uniref:Uncharacterized protein n=1 Tax=Anguilla anguilla TaxID=7936 RepID=A0A0E9WEP0_ANGAN
MRRAAMMKRLWAALTFALSLSSHCQRWRPSLERRMRRSCLKSGPGCTGGTAP